MDKQKRITAEETRLRELYRDVPEDTLALCDGLIKRAAFMRITLEDCEADINKKGCVENFTQSKDVPPYERGRPIVQLYNTMNKNYQSIMKQLADALPEPLADDVGADITRFVAAGRR